MISDRSLRQNTLPRWCPVTNVADTELDVSPTTADKPRGRGVSEDSRYIGAVPISGVAGRAVAVFGPINRVGLVR